MSSLRHMCVKLTRVRNVMADESIINKIDEWAIRSLRHVEQVDEQRKECK